MSTPTTSLPAGYSNGGNSELVKTTSFPADRMDASLPLRPPVQADKHITAETHKAIMTKIFFGTKNSSSYEQ